MMKKFLLIVCGSFVGVTLALMLFFITSVIFSIAMVGISASSGKSTAKVQDNSVLHLQLSGEIIERAGTAETSMMQLVQGNLPQTTSLQVLVKSIEKAAEDDKIKGIYLECDGSSAAPASRELLRNALVKFKKSGKWIIAYGNEGYDQGDYYLATAADSIFLNPIGAVDVHGMASATPYLKRLFDKVGVEMQVIRVGRFKSAVEPYMLDSISPENREQQLHYMGSIWGVMSESMAKARKIDPVKFNTMVDSVLVTQPTDSLLKDHLVDKLFYRNEMEDHLRALIGLKADDDLSERLVEPVSYVTDIEDAASGEHVAVLYAVGEIDAGGGPMGSSSGIDTEQLSEEILDLAKNDDVKGLVLRVNSPGGSAFGSEQMWHALEEFKKTGKPFAVSMSDYAASGGYYISAGADRIFAMPTTITGSIGIFGVIPCFQDLAENKLGVKTSVVKTNANADLGITTKRLTATQRAAIQRMINAGYDLFTKRCATGRKVSQDSIKSIAEGRVWDGITAKKIGLVDELGDLDAAIAWVGKKAGLKDGDIKTQNYPAVETDWRAMLDKLMAQQYEARLQGEMGFLYQWHKELQTILNRHHVLCLMENGKIEF